MYPLKSYYNSVFPVKRKLSFQFNFAFYLLALYSYHHKLLLSAVPSLHYSLIKLRKVTPWKTAEYQETKETVIAYVTPVTMSWAIETMIAGEIEIDVEDKKNSVARDTIFLCKIKPGLQALSLFPITAIFPSFSISSSLKNRSFSFSRLISVLPVSSFLIDFLFSLIASDSSYYYNNFPKTS